MSRCAILALSLVALPLTACLTPSRDYHGYVADEAQPREMKPGEDTRSSVLAQLGSPSTTSIFDENTWIYMSELQERVAYLNPKVKSSITPLAKHPHGDANSASGNKSSAQSEPFSCHELMRLHRTIQLVAGSQFIAAGIRSVQPR